MVFDLSAFAVTAALAYGAFTSYKMSLVWRILRIGAFGAAMGNLVDSLVNSLFGTEFNYVTVICTVGLALYAVVRHDKLTKMYQQIIAEKKEAKRQKREKHKFGGGGINFHALPTHIRPTVYYGEVIHVCQ